MSRRQKLFVWCRGQDDNVGDTVLRRAMIDAVRDRGRVHVLVGHGSPSYVRGLDLREDDVVFTSGRAWLLALYRAALSRRAELYFNPGEVRVDRQSAVAHALLLPVQTTIRSFRLGVAITGLHGILAWPIRLSARLTRANVWRDTQTGRSLPGSTAPDWAFDLGSRERHASRTNAALTFRSDHALLPDEHLAAIRTALQQAGLQVFVFAQVRRDRQGMRDLAQRWGVEYRDWPDDVDHLEFERTLREWFRSCEVVISDRLHALIVGMTEGAAPAGLIPHDDHKIRSHLGVIGLGEASIDATQVDAETVEKFIHEAIKRAPAMPDVVAQAAADLDAAVRKGLSTAAERGDYPADR